jgi:hypothetical protein
MRRRDPQAQACKKETRLREAGDPIALPGHKQGAQVDRKVRRVGPSDIRPQGFRSLETGKGGNTRAQRPK